MSDTKTLAPDLIEKVFCKPFDKFKPQVLSKESMGTFINIMMAKNDAIKEIKTKLIKKVWFFKVFESRLKAFGAQVDDRTSCFVIVECADTVGSAVMWATYLAYKAKEKGVKKLTFDDFINIIPNGLPSKQHEHECWEAQKGRNLGIDGVDNLLDIVAAGKSIEQ